MPLTRTQATALLGASETSLYDESRATALRGHSPARLAQLVSRARKARDRARDLEKRQKLASRAKTGSKSGKSGQANARTGEKAVLLGEILARFQAQLKTAGKPAKKSVAKKPSTKKAATTKKAAAKKATSKSAARKSAPNSAAKKTAAKAPAKGAKKATKAAAKKAGAKVATKSAVKKTGKAAATKSTATKAAKPAAKSTGRSKQATTAAPRKPRGISPRKALENTRALLEQKQAEARAPKPWQALDGHHDAANASGYQSEQAAGKALELHAAESRMAATVGSASTRGRKNQGKRDQRNSTE